MTLRHIPLLLVLAAASAGALAQNQPAPADPGRSFSGTAREIDLVIGPHDVLDIQVFGMPELTRTAPSACPCWATSGSPA